MRIVTGVSWVLGAALSMSGVALAEMPDDGPPPPAGPRTEGRPFQKRALEKMRMMRLIEIQSALNLDEATTLKLSAVLKKHDVERDRMREEVHKEMKALRVLTRDAKPDEAKLNAAVDRLIALRQKMPEIQLAQIADARRILTPLQQAKLVLHMAKFHKQFRNMMHRAFKGRGHHGGPMGPGMGPGRGRGPRPGGPGGGPEMSPPGTPGGGPGVPPRGPGAPHDDDEF